METTRLTRETANQILNNFNTEDRIAVQELLDSITDPRERAGATALGYALAGVLLDLIGVLQPETVARVFEMTAVTARNAVFLDRLDQELNAAQPDATGFPYADPNTFGDYAGPDTGGAGLSDPIAQTYGSSRW